VLQCPVGAPMTEAQQCLYSHKQGTTQHSVVIPPPFSHVGITRRLNRLPTA